MWLWPCVAVYGCVWLVTCDATGVFAADSSFYPPVVAHGAHKRLLELAFSCVATVLCLEKCRPPRYLLRQRGQVAFGNVSTAFGLDLESRGEALEIVKSYQSYKQLANQVLPYS